MITPLQFGSVVLSPHLPWSVVLILAIVGAAISAAAAYHHARGWVARAATLVALLAGIVNPVVVREQRQPLNDMAIVVVDESASQQIGQRQSQTAEAAAAIAALLAERPGLDVRIINAGRTTGDDDGGTRLFDALEQARAQSAADRIAGVILITDGQVHDVPEQLPASLDAPVHALISGSRDEADRRLVVVEAPRYGIVGKFLSMKIRVEDDGSPGGVAAVSVKVSGEVVFEQRVRAGVEITIPFELGHAGASVVEVTASPAASELTLANNRAVFAVNGVRDRLRVLLVSGEPHAGVRMWRNLLKADPAVDLVHFTILRTPQDANITPVEELSLIAFPTRELFEERLNDFDMIIFDRYRRRNVLPTRYLSNVARYVEDGGALLIAAGPEFAGTLSLYSTPLESVLPAQPTRRILEQPFRPELTTLGDRHPVTAGLDQSSVDGGEAGWGRWLRQIDAVARRGDVLMTGVDDRPLLVLDRVGEGRVAQLLSDQAWLWARGYEGGGPQAELLRRLAHWLMKEPDLEEEALRAQVRGQRITVEQRTLAETPRPVTVTGPDGGSRAVTLEADAIGSYQGSVLVEDPGIYVISDGSRETLAVVGSLNARELASVKATADVLGPVIAQTGGAAKWLEDGLPDIRFVAPGRRTSGTGWIGLRAQGKYRVTGFTEFPLAPPWLLLALIMGGLLLAWRLEGR